MSKVSASKANVLVVDQEPEACHLVKTALIPEGYEVILSKSSASALSYIQRKTVDLILVDISLPGLSGIKLLSEAHYACPTIGIVAMFKDYTPDLALSSLQAGAQAVLVKPFDIKELKKTIEEVTQKTHLIKENIRTATLRPLFELNKSIASQFDAQRIFNNIVRLARIETRANAVSLVLHDEVSHQLVVKATLGLPKGLSCQDFDISRICWSVIKSGKPVLVNPRSRRAENEASATSILCAPLSSKGKVTGVINCLKTKADMPFTDSDLELLSILAGQAAITAENMRLVNDVELHRSAHEMFLAKSLDAQEDERKRVSAELHDGLAQWLISALYCAQLSNTFISLSRFDEAKDEMHRVQSIIDQCIKELRRIIMDLHPRELAEIGFVGVIQRNLNYTQKERGMYTQLQILGDQRRLPLRQEVTVYRIFVEALNNIWKHACASSIEVALTYMAEHIKIEIADDGCGFDLEKALNSSIEQGSIGLMSMKERAEMVNGKLDIETAPGKGTKISFIMPLPNNNIN